MKILMFFLIITTTMQQNYIICDFDSQSDIENWQIVNDGVMGGLSQSSFDYNADSNAVFSGEISLENNGGFASVRLSTDVNEVQKYKCVNLKVKGKPSTYQFRLKKSQSDDHSYVNEFEVSSEWKTVQLKLSDFYPRYRGRSLNLPNFEANKIQEVGILIGNKTEENFELEIDKIYLSN